MRLGEVRTWEENQDSPQDEAPLFFPAVRGLPTDVLDQGNYQKKVHLISVRVSLQADKQEQLATLGKPQKACCARMAKFLHKQRDKDWLIGALHRGINASANQNIDSTCT